MLKNEKNVFGAAQSLLGFRAEIERTTAGMSAIISGVRAITEFSSTLAVVRLVGFRVKISGADLSITVLEDGSAEISGKICDMEFVYDKF